MFPAEPSSVVLRHYQEEMRDKSYENIFVKKHRGTLCVAPMGCGKSLTMACSAVKASVHGGVLILAHFKMLVRGNKKAVERLGRNCYIYTGEEKDVIWSDVKKNGAIVSGSVQAIVRALHKIDPSAIKLILIDEGHHAALNSAYHKIQQHFGCPVIMYTATPDREDGEPLVSDHALCESVAYNGQVRDFIKEGWILLPKIVFEKTVKLDYSVFSDDNSAITERQAQEAWEANKAHYAVIKPFLDRCGNMQSVGFAPTVKLAKLWSGLVNDVKPGRSEYVASYKPGDYTDAQLDFDQADRRLIEQKFFDGSIQHLWNQGVYLEGADLVPAQACMFGIITTSRPKVAQGVGRVLRPCEENGVSILSGLERATAAQRLEAIAKSRKPCAYVFDYGGSTGPKKLVHPIELFCDNHTPPELRTRILDRAAELAEEADGNGGYESDGVNLEGSVNIEEVMLEQEESYKKFLVRDARVRRSIAVEVEVMTRDIDPFGPPEVAGHQRYQTRKINPPPPKVVEQIQKYTKQLGKNYSPDFYRNLTNAKAFSVLADLRKKVEAIRGKEACPSWLIGKLRAAGNFSEPSSYQEGIKLLKSLERRKA